MQIISQANENVLSLLKRFRKTNPCSRWLKYCAQTPVDGGMLIFNLLTRELLLLSGEEYSRATELDYLQERWFVVPEDTDEQELSRFVRWFLTNRRKKPDAITAYTIFPTTDCNARCFYCFELGRSRISMDHETALKVVQYIKTHCGGKKIRLSWFGGEPLFHQEAIDTICDGLRREGVEFTSFAVSNGYLFDSETVRKAVENWNLKRVQITLDGTEQVYNRTKAYIYREGNPYRIVMDNITRLLDASVYVSIRMNMDLYNAEDLLELTRELTRRFGGRKNLSAYAHHLFKGDTSMAELHEEENWQAREEAMCRIEQTLTESGLMSGRGISKDVKLTNCMADSGSAVTILPDGSIGLCEHFSETEFVGHIDREGFDEQAVASWKEPAPQIPECADCFYFPECTMLKKCANASVCFPQYRQGLHRKTLRQMENEYHRWQTQTAQEDNEEMDPEDC